MYLAIGKRLLSGQESATDPFIHIAKYHWHIWHEWGSYLIYQLTYLAAGINGTILLKSALITAMVFLAIRPMLRERNPWLLPISILAVYAASLRFSERASLFSDFLSLLIINSVLHRHGKNWRWLPLVFLVWTNLHPGYYLGLIFLGILPLQALINADFAAFRKLTFIWILCLVACLINPIGIAGLSYPFEKWFDPSWQIFRARFFEWIPTFDERISLSQSKTLAVMWIVTASTLMLSWRRKPWVEALFFILLIYLGANALRFTLLSSFGCLAIIAALFPRNWTPLQSWDAKAWILLFFLQLGLSAYLIWCPLQADSLRISFAGGINEFAFPVRAADFIEQQNLNGNIFNETDWGSYLSWRWNGERKVFYHGHIDDPTYLDRVYMKAYGSLEDFEKLIKEYDLRIFIIRPDNAIPGRNLVIAGLRNTEKWQLVYEDSSAMIYQRR